MWLMPEIEHHLEEYAAPGPYDALLVLENGSRTLPSAFSEIWAAFSEIWAATVRRVGRDGIGIHDLGHTGNHFAALTCATTRELMGA